MDLLGLRTALLVVDMQNGFCHPQGGCARLGMPGAERLIAAAPGCRRLIDAAHAAGAPVIYTRHVHQPDLADLGVLLKTQPHFPEMVRIGFLVKGSWDSEVIDELQPAPSDYTVEKNRFSAFISSGLEPLLRSLGVSNLIVCGVLTSVCVESNVRDASQRELRVFVASDATADVEQGNHDAALKIIGRMFGWVVDSEQAAQAIRALGASSRAA